MPTNVVIHRYPNDPLCLRVSIGGNQKTGMYCIYRGTREETIAAIEKILIVLKYMPELEIESDASEIGKS